MPSYRDHYRGHDSEPTDEYLKSLDDRHSGVISIGNIGKANAAAADALAKLAALEKRVAELEGIRESLSELAWHDAKRSEAARYRLASLKAAQAQGATLRQGLIEATEREAGISR
jgi:hypothetical protein